MDSKEKFSNKVDNYKKYRPGYPTEFIDYIVNEVGLLDSIVADVGAGTGKLTKLLAPHVKKIYAVEPNDNMRSACVEYCSMFDNFIAVDGSAEQTNLPEKSVHFITVAQAFHWFERDKTKLEFQRILKAKGKVILVWNSRVADDPFIKENYELFKRVCPEFKGFSAGMGTDPDEYADFFKNGNCDYRVFDNDMQLTLDEYIGRHLSASYAPDENDENYTEFVDRLNRLFDKYNVNGKVFMPVKTHSYVGEM